MRAPCPMPTSSPFLLKSSDLSHILVRTNSRLFGAGSGARLWQVTLVAGTLVKWEATSRQSPPSPKGRPRNCEFQHPTERYYLDASGLPGKQRDFQNACPYACPRESSGPYHWSIYRRRESLAWNNDKEYHHFFPKAYLARDGVEQRKANAIANIVMLTSHSNLLIRDKAPATYLDEIRAEIGEETLQRRLSSLLISDAAYGAAMDNDYDRFLSIRAADLQTRALTLVGDADALTSSVTPSAASVDDSDVDPSE